MTNAQAARCLSCPEGTLATRLARARERLRARLTRHGLAPSVGLLSAALGPVTTLGNVSPPLLEATVRAATAVVAGQGIAGGIITAKVALLTKEVGKAMLMDKLRVLLVLLLGLGIAGAGTGLLAYGKAQAPKARQEVVPPPTAIPQEKASAADSSSPNFAVHAPTARLARLVGETAERLRKELALRWLGKAIPDWPEPCSIQVTITPDGTGGATSFAFDSGKVSKQSMQLVGPLDQILANALPHEITHTILAHHFGRPIPRWADEGIALLSEDDEEQERHEELARLIVETRDRVLSLHRLFALNEFPSDVMVLYAEGFSVTRFLVGQKDRPTFLAFVQSGINDGWDKAVATHYRYRDVEDLESAWLSHLRRHRPKEAVSQAPSVSPESKEGKTPVSQPPTSPPPTVLTYLGSAFLVVPASMDEEGRILLRLPVLNYVPKTTLTRQPGEEEKTVTVYTPVESKVLKSFDAKEVEVWGMDGNRVDPGALPKLLGKEIPVLVPTDGKRVDSSELRIIKEGTMILVVPVDKLVGGAVP
jgi:hypothetical protein